MLSKDKIDEYLDLLAGKILERFGDEASIRIIVVGGAAIALNYHFRDSTMDIDAYSKNSVALEELVADVARDEGLEDDWLNHNVMVTPSFTRTIEHYAPLYKVFRGVLEVHTADALTLVCMKSVCCRPDSHDIPDIANLLDAEPQITFEDIVTRFMALYGDWDKMKADAQMYLTARYQAMPPDLVDMIFEMLPENVKHNTKPEDMYKVCNEMYKQCYAQ